MTHTQLARTAVRRTRSPAPSSYSASSDHHRAVGRAAGAVPKIGITIYGYRSGEAVFFGYNHIDVQCAERLGISVEIVAYSPDSEADFTLMLGRPYVTHP